MLKIIKTLYVIYTNRGLSLPSLKKRMGPSLSWNTREIREILLVGLGDWKLKNTDFSRKITYD